MNVYEKIGLPKVINCSGKMTKLGVSTLSESVKEAISNAGSHYVVIDDLLDTVGNEIAKIIHCEDICVTASASSGIVIAVAATITGDHLSLIESMPNHNQKKKEVILQKGHAVNYGAPMETMINIGGGTPVLVGQSNKVEREHIEQAITEDTCALLYVKSHHAVQKGMQSIETMIDIARNHKIPLIVDAAAEEDLEKYYNMGADLVIYSGAKALAGPASGFIAGRQSLIKSCKKQYKGIGRAMKVGKENMMGLYQAILDYQEKNSTKDHQMYCVETMMKELNDIEGINIKLVQDEAGREIFRAQLKIDEKIFNKNAYDLGDYLKQGNPSIYTREHYINLGILNFDFRSVTTNELQQVIMKIKDF
ncbi:DgaE family pyridoxal phosphate-dependent ammonia lyase [Vallitalea maricola]|uniref:DgaE family pyridoxal phosphate-dependent ammonia lyase n=1 Tax=Vallitalea maricola TaxID=3074433 RepID=A0ACB5UFU7_9FIRM|nr:DgaE family pyridoxal phosphate-dependent ammonia lyase [Vallitalea sp. AN17-2]